MISGAARVAVGVWVAVPVEVGVGVSVQVTGSVGMGSSPDHVLLFSSDSAAWL
jgi:hypothetical protein